jgi:hypothetical protein
VQWFNSIALQIRKQINVMIAWRFKNQKEMRNICEELTKYDYNEFLKICEYIF